MHPEQDSRNRRIWEKRRDLWSRGRRIRRSIRRLARDGGRVRGPCSGDGGSERSWPISGMSESNEEKQPSPESGGEGPSRPKSARPEAPRPASERPGLRGQRERPKGRGPRRGSGRSRDGARRQDAPRRPPVSARVAMDGEPLEATLLAAFPARGFEAEGVSWIARETGRTSIGSETSAKASLMHVSFSKEEHPERVEFEALVVAESLEGLGVDQLITLLAEGRPAPPHADPSGD